MKRYRILIYSLFFCTLLTAQEKRNFTISGYVKDASNGEFSIGASVFIKELMKGGSTNQYGFYSITVEEGNYTLVSTYVGYE
ncbi:MAG TPA: carboxypeptidase-like regulatory domain-containing protein, partial [Bacteroidia bacterium]|nr:carboxypeptidase-like regulatory domain-containing protein [Bacteroidia bacterium]